VTPQSVLILWTIPTSYFLASLRELLTQLDGDSVITVVSKHATEWYPDLKAAYDLQSTNWVEYQDFKPRDYLNFDLILMSSWNIKKYRTSARLNRRSCKVMVMDNQNLGTIKQKIFLSSKMGPMYVRYLADFVFVPGARQKSYATQIGFQADRIFRGALSYDDKVFHPKLTSNQNNQFCFIGRKVAVKGLDVLIAAYREYRTLCTERKIEPWKLVIAGPGKVVENIPTGVQELGYLSPSEASEIMSNSSCFVLPSKYEPFGVVLTEAAASGCLLIASSSVGAVDELIKDYVNGFIFPQNSSGELAYALLKISQFNLQEIENGRVESIDRAKNLRPEIWSKMLLEIYANFANSKS